MGTVKGDPSGRLREIRLQQRIYRSLQKDSNLILGKPSKEITEYEKTYQREFKRLYLRWLLDGFPLQSPNLEKDKLISAIRKSDVTLIGDFHTYPQAQRTALRVLREVYQRGEKWIIALEMVPSHFQKYLTAYQKGKMSLQTFHKKIRYAEAWGFPWKNYEPLFEWAKENNVPMLALNRPKEAIFSESTSRQGKGTGDLKERDQWAAGLITDLYASHRQKSKAPLRTLVLYGELHLAQSHLPSEISKLSKSYLGQPLQTVCIHQNNDELYWKLARAGKIHQVGSVGLDAKNFCILSGTPWGKLQSLIHWAEGDFELHEEALDPEAEFIASVINAGRLISEFFGTRPVSFDTLTLYSTEKANTFLRALKKTGHHRQELRLAAQLVEHNQNLLYTQSKLIYLPSFSTNTAAEMAAMVVYRQNQTFRRRHSDRFLAHILEQAFSFFGSLLINPKRKCDLPGDHIARLKAFKDQRSSREKRISQITIEFLKLGSEEKLQYFAKHQPDQQWKLDYWMSSEAIAKILGKSMHDFMTEGKVSVEEIKAIFFSREISASERTVAAFDRFISFKPKTKRKKISSKRDLF